MNSSFLSIILYCLICPVVLLVNNGCRDKTGHQSDVSENQCNIMLSENMVIFNYDTISGIGHEVGCTRRDPSDLIQVGNTWYVWYTKVYGRSAGYWGTIWYATSIDEGFTWFEQGEALGKGEAGTFDSQATFTPNILYARGKYYLFYTGVKPTPGLSDGVFENNSVNDFTAIGVAVSKSPDGPFIRFSQEPILKVSDNEHSFDSYRVDDASLLYREGKYWLYYKGRNMSHGESGPVHTQMGVAFANDPYGPFSKFDNPVLTESHEVFIWPCSEGIFTLASISSTIEYAPDGLDFSSQKLNKKVDNRPNAPGGFRPDLMDPDNTNYGMDWGISMVHNGDESYLIRFKCRF